MGVWIYIFHSRFITSLCNISSVLCVYSVHINTLPFVFVFGVATAVSTLHRSVPHHVTSKLHNRVFHSPPAVSYLNQIVDKVSMLILSSLFGVATVVIQCSSSRNLQTAQPSVPFPTGSAVPQPNSGQGVYARTFLFVWCGYCSNPVFLIT